MDYYGSGHGSMVAIDDFTVMRTLVSESEGQRLEVTTDENWP
jgi:hypothetical protein